MTREPKMMHEPNPIPSNSDPYSLFVYAMRSPATREKYIARLGKFFDFIGIEGSSIQEKCSNFVNRAKTDEASKSNWVFNSVLTFIQFQKDRVERKEITGATLRNYTKSIKLFFEMSDIIIPWKKISRGLPKSRNYAIDRAPTIEEVRKLTEYPDRRIKPIVYTMCSSGIRLGAWDFLRWGNITPIQREGKVAAAKLVVYAGEDDEYFTFITPEAYFALKGWMDYRASCGEKITKDSWLVRNLWDVTTPRGPGGFVTLPKKLRSAGVKRLIERALFAQGIRQKLEAGKRRHEFQADHGLRKMFKTRCELAGMKSINIETLIGHSIGISDSYYRATESDLLEDYLKAVNHLTISEENERVLKASTQTEEQDKHFGLLMQKFSALEKRMQRYERFTQKFMHATPDQLETLGKVIFKEKPNDDDIDLLNSA